MAPPCGLACAGSRHRRRRARRLPKKRPPVQARAAEESRFVSCASPKDGERYRDAPNKTLRRYWTPMPAALSTSPIFEFSDFIRAVNSSGEVGAGSVPDLRKISL